MDCELCTADCELCYRLQAVGCALWSWFPSDVSLGVLERKEKYKSSKPAYCVFVTMNKGQVTMQWRTMGMTWEVNCLEKEMKVPR